MILAPYLTVPVTVVFFAVFVARIVTPGKEAWCIYRVGDERLAQPPPGSYLTNGTALLSADRSSRVTCLTGVPRTAGGGSGGAGDAAKPIDSVMDCQVYVWDTLVLRMFIIVALSVGHALMGYYRSLFGLGGEEADPAGHHHFVLINLIARIFCRSDYGRLDRLVNEIYLMRKAARRRYDANRTLFLLGHPLTFLLLALEVGVALATVGTAVSMVQPFLSQCYAMMGLGLRVSVPIYLVCLLVIQLVSLAHMRRADVRRMARERMIDVTVAEYMRIQQAGSKGGVWAACCGMVTANVVIKIAAVLVGVAVFYAVYKYETYLTDQFMTNVKFLKS